MYFHPYLLASKVSEGLGLWGYMSRREGECRANVSTLAKEGVSTQVHVSAGRRGKRV